MLAGSLELTCLIFLVCDVTDGLFLMTRHRKVTAVTPTEGQQRKDQY